MVPEARVIAMPPRLALAPGSTGKNSPVARSSSFSASRVTPGCTVTSMSAGRISSTLFMREKSTTTPPFTASPWPSSEVPAPQPTIGQPCSAQIFTSACTSARVSG